MCAERSGCCCAQVKKTAYAQSSQIRQIRKKMVEIMTREASSCDLKELVGKFIPEAIGAPSSLSTPLPPCCLFSTLMHQFVTSRGAVLFHVT